MDHDNCPLTFSEAFLNSIGGKGAISNINYYYYYYYYYESQSFCTNSRITVKVLKAMSVESYKAIL